MTYTRLLARTALLSALCLTGCPIPAPPVPPTPAPPSADCGDVCARWRLLGCSEAEDSPDGQPCEVLCDVMSDTWDTACMATVESCVEIEDC